MDNSKSKLEEEYREFGYSYQFNKIDAQIVNEYLCEKCKSSMRYIGLKKQVHLNINPSYIAISHCNNCGNEYEF